MPIKIPVKKTSQAHNKNQTPPKIQVGKPFIDRLTVGIDFPDHAEAADVHAYIWSVTSDQVDFQQAKPVGSYNRAWRLALPSCEKQKFFPYLQYRHVDHYARRMAVTLSPKDIGSQGFDEMQASLTSLIDGGWGAFVNRGRVTSIEVAVDLSGIVVDAFHVLPKQSTTVKTYTNYGRLETIYLGKKSGNQFRIYDRTAKRKAQGQPWYTGETTRIERVLRGQKMLLKDLPDIPNPFLAISPVDLPFDPAPSLAISKRYVWDLFCDSVRQRGLQPALKLLPENTYRKQFRKWLGENKLPWWNPEAVWQSWKPMLDELTILDQK